MPLEPADPKPTPRIILPGAEPEAGGIPVFGFEKGRRAGAGKACGAGAVWARWVGVAHQANGRDAEVCIRP